MRGKCRRPAASASAQRRRRLNSMVAGIRRVQSRKSKVQSPRPKDQRREFASGR
jgi:hypothetical protein